MDEDDIERLTMSDRELCKLELNTQELDEEFGELNPPVPTDPHDEVFEEICQPWQRQ